MNVLICHNVYQIYGGEDYVVAAEKALLEQYGHKVSLWTVTNDAITGLLGKVKAGLSASYNKQSKQTLKQLLDKDRPDVVHVHNFFPLMSPSIFDACQEMGVPVVQTLHNFRLFCAKGTLNRDGNYCNQCLNGSAYQSVKYGCYRDSKLQTIPVARMIDKHRREKTFVEKVDRFIALTAFSKSKFVQYGIPSEKIVIKPNFLTSERNLTPLSMRDIPAIYVGRLSEEKGIDTLIKISEKLPFPLKVLGTGPLQSVIEKEKNIDYLGVTDHEGVLETLKRTRVLILPSVCPESGLALSVKEAMMMAAGVVVSDIGSLGEVVQHEVTGLKAAVNDVDGFVESINRLVGDDSLWQSVSDTAVKFANENYTPEKNIEQLLAIYQGAIDEKA